MVGHKFKLLVLSRKQAQFQNILLITSNYILNQFCQCLNTTVFEFRISVFKKMFLTHIFEIQIIKI